MAGAVGRTACTLRHIWRLATSDGIPGRSLKVAIVVGTALNVINQYDALLGTSSINWYKLMLTFAMPYAVSTYGAVAVHWNAAENSKPETRSST